MGLPLTEATSLAEDAALSADHAGPAKRLMAATAMINRLIPWGHNRILILLSKILGLQKKFFSNLVGEEGLRIQRFIF
jgi:hypothetical protein